MAPQFNDTQPICLQISERIAEMILSKTVNEGEALPSVRQISSDLQVNPLTVTRAYQSLVDIGVVESRRGMGMYVQPGARERLLAHERAKFLHEEWPRIAKRLAALELDPIELLKSAKEGSDNE
jgi:GntR family transcriptional regulator